jgi:nucleotide-binding universal stress UspA family protein
MTLSIQRVCVPTDFSQCADLAVKYGAALARQNGAKLHLLHVVQDIDEKLHHADFTREGTSVKAFLKSLEEGASEYLSRLASQKEWHDLQVERVYVHGKPADQITRYAKQNKIDLLVMGTHGRSGLEHVFVGSVAERVVRTAPCPVLTVRCPLERGFVVSEPTGEAPGNEPAQ